VITRAFASQSEIRHRVVMATYGAASQLPRRHSCCFSVCKTKRTTLNLWSVATAAASATQHPPIIALVTSWWRDSV